MIHTNLINRTVTINSLKRILRLLRISRVISQRSSSGKRYIFGQLYAFMIFDINLNNNFFRYF